MAGRSVEVGRSGPILKGMPRSSDADGPRRPPEPRTPAGDLRRVGVEIEFAGLDVPDAARLVGDLFGGDIEDAGANRRRVTGTGWGDFTVELDAQILQDGPDGKDAVAKPDGAALEALGKTVAGIVPVEIVAPPIPWPELGRLADLTDGLRAAGGRGTADNPLYGFGLHLNPEVAHEDADYILAMLRAYMVLSEGLREEIGVDPTRRLLPYIEDFPDVYVAQVLDPDYRPGQAALIADYIAANPTRNRALDMLPLFRHLDEEAVTSRLDDASLVKARPTFHYRLPDCDLSDPDWSPVTEWNRWVEVEELAADGGRLAAIAAEHRARLARPAPTRWLEKVRSWVGQ